MSRILRFTANWCKACEEIEPMVTRLCDDLDIEHVRVEVDDESAQALIQRHLVTAIPVIIYEAWDGTPRYRVNGVDTERIESVFRQIALDRKMSQNISLPQSEEAEVKWQQTL